MGAKTISAGIAVVVAAVVGGVVGGKVSEKPTTELSVVAGGTLIDEAVTAIAQTKPDVADSICELQREGTKDGVRLAWVCNGARMPDKVQDELTKLAGPDGVNITLKPRREGEKVIFDSTIQNGVKPSTDPIPEPPKPPEVKPAEAPAEEVEAVP